MNPNLLRLALLEACAFRRHEGTQWRCAIYRYSGLRWKDVCLGCEISSCTYAVTCTQNLHFPAFAAAELNDAVVGTSACAQEFIRHQRVAACF